MRPLPSNIAERVSTERNIHPEALSPSRTPVEVLEFSSKRIAIRLFSPIIVPTRVNGGDSGVTGLTTAGGDGVGAAATVGVGGRRDEENNGRSRVAESFETGMAHKGLPVAGASAAGGPPHPRAAIRGSSSDRSSRSRSKPARFRQIENGPRLRRGRPSSRRRP